ncbi:MAG: hypothetical protein ACRC0V_12325, partial [Fusobacteriaceae bacterium]
MSYKHEIAKKAAELVENKDIIFINSSSTAALIIKYLGNKHVTVVTNNIRAFQFESGTNIDIILLGGEVNKKKICILGDYASNMLSKITSNKCFLGVSGISAEYRINSSVLQEIDINSMMIKKC